MEPGQTKRLLSLDAFRGFTIAAMILVNLPGSWSYIYPPLRHAEWHGCTPTDFIFPFFLFIVGVSMWFSFKKFDYRLTKTSASKLIRRAVLIFFAGIFIRAFPFYNIDFSTLRYMGVLQRIGIAFGVAGFLVLAIKDRRILIAISAAILLIYWYLMYSYDGHPPYSLENNFARTVDVAVFGEPHLWNGYGKAFDPEGLLSTLPSIVTVLIGFLVAPLLGTSNQKNILNTLIPVGAILAILGLLWHGTFPINKALWTSSYVLYTAGAAAILLAIFVWVIDVKDYKKWSMPFVVFGVNPLFAYILSELWSKFMWTVQLQTSAGESLSLYEWIYTSVFVPIAGNMNGSLLFAITHIVFFWIIVHILYRKKIFIKV